MFDDNIADSRPLRGLILAGGGSKRFGSDKRQALAKGRSLLEHAVSIMRPIDRRPLISIGTDPVGGWTGSTFGPDPTEGRDDSRLTSGALSEIERSAEWIMDLYPNAGPLAGIHSGLRAVNGRASALLVLACDLPGVEKQTLNELIKHSTAGDEAIRVCRAAESGRIQPLCGVYRTSILPRLEAWLEGGQRTVMTFMESVGFTTIEVPDPQLLNVNRPEDLLLFGR